MSRILLLCLCLINALVYSENILLPGESLSADQCLALQGDGVEWDQAILSCNGNTLELYVKKDNNKEIVWTAAGKFGVSYFQQNLIGIEMLTDGRLAVNSNKLRRGSYPEFPIKPIAGSYLILEKSSSKNVRIAIYSPQQELLFASDENMRASHVLYPDQTFPPGTILTLKENGGVFDKATLEYDGYSLYLYEHYDSFKPTYSKQLVWNSFEQSCGGVVWGGGGCKGNLFLHCSGALVSQACFNGTFFSGSPMTCLFIEVGPERRARLSAYSYESGVYWTSDMNRMNENNMRGHWD